MLVLGWAVLPGSPWLWTAIALGVLALPLFKWLISSVVGMSSQEVAFGFPPGEFGSADGGTDAAGVVFLADQARLMCDAVTRPLVRLLVTRLRLLEWETAASTEQRLGMRLTISAWNVGNARRGSGQYRRGRTLAAIGALGRSPLLVGWFLSPPVAYWISRPRQVRELTLSDDERANAAEDHAKDLAFLRDLRPRGGQLAAA